ncbi:Cysteine--tRNA ligase [Capsicum chinense]|nr:Cysteine--tRNA ligase [Capsicum chinense]
MDLIFPHRENEIAQSSAACGPESHISYWMHNGYVTNNGEKMSKALGNFVTIGDTQLADDLHTAEMINAVALQKALRLMNTYSKELKKELTEQQQQELFLSLNALQNARC